MTLRVYHASAAYRSVDAEHMQCVQRLLGLSRDRVMIRSQPVVGDALVERARAIAATRFILDTDCDVMLSIDADVLFRAEDALRICELAVDHDIVGGCYVTRSSERCFPACTFLDDYPIQFDGQHRAEPIRWAASGFMAVHRRVFEKLAKNLTLLHPNHPQGHRFYRFFGPFEHTMENGEPILLSEDYALCERARQEGFEVTMDPGAHLIHLGTYAYELYDMAREAKPAAAPMRLTRTPEGRYKTEIQVPAPKPVVEFAEPKPLNRQQRRLAAKRQVPALAG